MNSPRRPQPAPSPLARTRRNKHPSGSTPSNSAAALSPRRAPRIAAPGLIEFARRSPTSRSVSTRLVCCGAVPLTKFPRRPINSAGIPSQSPKPPLLRPWKNRPPGRSTSTTGPRLGTSTSSRRSTPARRASVSPSASAPAPSKNRSTISTNWGGYDGDYSRIPRQRSRPQGGTPVAAPIRARPRGHPVSKRLADIPPKSRTRVAMTMLTDFPIQNLPYGVFRRSLDTGAAAIGVAIGDRILDLRRSAAAGLFDALPPETRRACACETLNALMALTPRHWHALRARLTELLSAQRDAAPR